MASVLEFQHQSFQWVVNWAYSLVKKLSLLNWTYSLVKAAQHSVTGAQTEAEVRHQTRIQEKLQQLGDLENNTCDG